MQEGESLRTVIIGIVLLVGVAAIFYSLSNFTSNTITAAGIVDDTKGSEQPEQQDFFEVLFYLPNDEEGVNLRSCNADDYGLRISDDKITVSRDSIRDFPQIACQEIALCAGASEETLDLIRAGIVGCNRE